MIWAYQRDILIVSPNPCIKPHSWHPHRPPVASYLWNKYIWFCRKGASPIRRYTVLSPLDTSCFVLLPMLE